MKIRQILGLIVVLALFMSACDDRPSEKSVDKETVQAGNPYYMYIVVARFNATNEELIQIKDDVDFMLDKIPGIIDASSGIQDTVNAYYNLAITVRFKDKSAKSAYSTNPYRQAFVDQYGKKVEELEIIEYEVN